MWKTMEEVLRGLKEEGIIEDMKSESGLPPGFRFHPTDEELITFYLASKVFNTTTTTINNNSFCSSINTTNTSNHNNATTSLFLSNYFSGVQIAEVDLTRCEPWDLPERAKMGEKEWYLFSLRDRKYPSGLRTNRATETGYWKATGKDRQIYASSIATNVGGGGGGGGSVLIGMKKTLVFYQGRAPRGNKTKWVMHEYRLDGHFTAFRHSSKEEWVICRIFYKNGEKKTLPIIHHPPLPLSPFVNTLPPLQEQTSTTAATATQAAADSSLLHSLLSNPLPNFSSISGSDPIFPSTTPLVNPSVDISSTLFNSLPRLTANAAVTVTAAAATATKQQQQEQNWLDRICPQVQTQYFQNQYHNHDHIFNQTIDNYSHLNNYTTTTATAAATTGDNHDEKDNNVEMSTSFGVAALDKIPLLNPAESWSFQYP